MKHVEKHLTYSTYCSPLMCSLYFFVTISKLQEKYITVILLRFLPFYK